MRSLPVLIERVADGRTIRLEMYRGQIVGLNRALLTGTSTPETRAEMFITRDASRVFLKREKHRIFLCNYHRNSIYVGDYKLTTGNRICVLGETVAFRVSSHVDGAERVRFLIDTEDDGGLTESVVEEF